MHLYRSILSMKTLKLHISETIYPIFIKFTGLIQWGIESLYIYLKQSKIFLKYYNIEF